MSTNPIYRTREDFIELLFTKLKESYGRQIKIAEKELLTLEENKTKLKELNSVKENILLNIKKD